ncbi:LamG domain-containing protein [Candidatus Poribacteria bacterium]|nr:LamG domain-containing protein [Candidatus Poribacteria bacterium]MYA98814.1 LamG domain-containing protein [Candidatus Poribacteria bacterium]
MKKLIYLFVSMLTVTSFCHSGYAEQVVTDGLVSYWTFDRQDIADNTVKDVWGKNDATIVGDPRVIAGRMKDALEFDGLDDYVNLTNLGDFGNQMGSATFEAWIKPSFKKGNMTLFRVIDADCMGWGLEFSVTMEPVTILDNVVIEDIIFSYTRYRTGKGSCRSTISAKSVRILDGKWHHIVYGYEPYVDAAGGERSRKMIHIDGRRYRFGKPLVSGAIFVPFTVPVYLGAKNNRGSAEDFFHGIIDEVRIYNRPLTYDEVRQNFEIGLDVEPVQKLPTVWGALKTRL